MLKLTFLNTKRVTKETRKHLETSENENTPYQNV